MIKFAHIDGNKAFFYISLLTCRKCQRKMVSSFADISPRDREKANIAVECSSDTLLCTDCLQVGGFVRKCNVCKHGREFPKEFKYQVIHYAKYADDEDSYKYICARCVLTKQAQVIEMLAGSDKTTKIIDQGVAE